MANRYKNVHSQKTTHAHNINDKKMAMAEKLGSLDWAEAEEIAKHFGLSLARVKADLDRLVQAGEFARVSMQLGDIELVLYAPTRAPDEKEIHHKKEFLEQYEAMLYEKDNEKDK